MRTRKKELEVIVSLLEQDHDDVESLADEVWKAIDNFRREREAWVIGVDHDGMQLIYGVYDSEAVANSDLSAKGNLRGITDHDRYRIFKVVSSSSKQHEPEFLFDSK